MESLDCLPFVVQLDECDDPFYVIESMALGPFVAGSQRWARDAHLERVKPDATLLPPGVVPIRSARRTRSRAELAVGDGWTLFTKRWSDATADLTVTATSDELARTILEQAKDGAVEDEPPADEAVTMRFWYLRCGQPKRSARSVRISPWPQIRRNYAAPVASGFDRLMELSGEDLSARLLLLHGPPGTGKTTALRALGHAWQDWCTIDCVLDPERLFKEPGYLLDVALGEEDEDDDDDRRWRLLVLEDCDELIRAEAKQSSGQSLSRLLNVTDGIVGQGRRVLVAITTNEDVSRLHPAVTRPGRCLARIEVGRLPRNQAATWLGSLDGIGPDGATLAELYALRGQLEKVERVEPPAVVGQYL